MSINVPSEFQAFVRQQVEAGAFASVQEAVDAALNGYLAVFRELRRSLQEGLAELDRGEAVDGDAFMAELLVDSRARAATRLG